jgi:hypothetical protein
MSRKQFLYNISQASYEREWGVDYQRPGPGARFIALLFHLIPKFGPFKAFGFRLPTPEVERMFEGSFDAAVRRNRSSFAQAKEGGLRLSNRDLDTGRPVSPGEYALTDRTYDKLLVKLAQKKFDGVTPEIRENILGFYDAMKSSDQHGIGAELDALRGYRPERRSAVTDVVR